MTERAQEATMVDRKRDPYVRSARHSQAPRSLSRPMPGLYKCRMVRGGPLCAAAIEYAPPRDPETGEPLERSWYWTALVNGEVVSAPEVQPSDTVWAIHEHGEFIDQETYDLMVAQAAWDRQHAPGAPLANPRKRIDLLSTDLPF